MSGLSSVLNTAKLALNAQQFGLAVAGHNIANVNTSSYSRQKIQFSATDPLKFGGHLLGSGVEIETIQRVNNEFIEERLINLKSDLAANEESAAYIQILEANFSENSDTSISNILSEFWNSWHDLSNNPIGASERILVYETGVLAADRIHNLNEDLTQMESDLSREVLSALPEVSRLSADLAKLNADIVGSEAIDTANDLRDQRNALLTELSKLIGIKTFEQPNGSVIVTTGSGYSLVNGVDSYALTSSGGEIQYQTPYGGMITITDQITGGSIGGWLVIQKEVIPKFKNELDVMAHELIWAVNLQHSQGVGEEYFSMPVTGTNATGESGLLSTLRYGNKIDYSKDFSMWIQDNSTLTPTYTNLEIDMGLSTAAISNWTGLNPDEDRFTYEFTVTGSGTVNANANFTITDGPGIGVIQTGPDVSTALNGAIAAQTLTISSAGGTRTISVADGGDAERSAASIAAALSSLDGVTATAAQNTATIDITNILPPAATSAHPYDKVSFTLFAGSRSEAVSFEVGATGDMTRNNFLNALNTSILTLNGSTPDLSIDASRLLSDNVITFTSRSGENIGIEHFDVLDLPIATLDNFQNLGVDTVITAGNFTNLSNGETLTFSITTAQGSATVNYVITDDTDQNSLALDLQNALAGAGLGAIGVTTLQVGAFVQITGDASAGFVDFQAVSVGSGSDEAFDLTPGAGTSPYPAYGDNTLLFNGIGDREQYAGDNAVSMTINGTDNVTIDLRRVDTTSQTAVAQAFYRELDTHVTNAVVENTGTAVTIRSLAESASDFSFTAGTETSGVDGSFDISVPNALPLATDTFTLDGADAATFSSVTETDSILFDGAVLTESGGAGVDSAVKTGLITINLEDGYSIRSNIAGTAGGLFNMAAGVDTATADAMITFGGDGGFQNFNPGDLIAFRIDGNYVNFLVGAGDDTDPEFASIVQGGLLAAGLQPSIYSIVRNGSHVSVLKSDGTPIEITEFNDDRSGGGAFAQLAVSSGEILSSQNRTATSNTIGPGGVITWKKFDSNGFYTGRNGSLEIGDAGTYLVEGSMTFDITDGTLVAGNTFSLNTNTDSIPEPLQLRTLGRANSILDTYTFKVLETNDAGKIGSDDVEIQWTNSITYGSFTIEGNDPAFTPVTVLVDGMTLKFDAGSVFAGDTFTISTDRNGTPTGELPSDFHWTIDSFADQFNRQAVGMEASVTDQHQLRFAPDTDGFQPADFRYTGSDGFSEENLSITVNNYDVLTKGWTGMEIIRDNMTYAASGGWGFSNLGNPGYTVSLAPIDGFDMDNGFFVNLDGVRALTVNVDLPISDNGSVVFDIAAADGNYGFAFSAGNAEDSGLTAALGINTFFTGYDAMSIDTNELAAQARYLAASVIDAETGMIHAGNNANSLAIADLQYAATDMMTWEFKLGEEPQSKVMTTTVEDYYHVMVGSMGLKSQGLKRSLSYSETMVSKIGEQRDAISAVSLDEEMISMIQYQHAYSVAAKLLSITDEMMNTLITSY
ncbi:MAG: flagellar hook-associated protein FlgK [Pseudomonadota bacterium]